MVTNHFTREQCTLHFQPVRKVQENFKRLTGTVHKFCDVYLLLAGISLFQVLRYLGQASCNEENLARQGKGRKRACGIFFVNPIPPTLA